jgi:hypothetical protein
MRRCLVHDVNTVPIPERARHVTAVADRSRGGS